MNKKTTEELLLSAHEKRAIEEIKKRVSSIFAVDSFIMFGSKARGDSEEGSDIDLLILTKRELKRPEKHRISHQILLANLENETNISFVAIGMERWNSPLHKLVSLHRNIENEGVCL